MRDIAKIIEDDRNGKQLSQTERQIAVAYVQGKYDAVRELKIGNSSNINEVLDEISAEIEEQVLESLSDGGDDWFAAEKVNECLEIIDKYRAEIVTYYCRYCRIQGGK